MHIPKMLRPILIGLAAVAVAITLLAETSRRSVVFREPSGFPPLYIVRDHQLVALEPNSNAFRSQPAPVLAKEVHHLFNYDPDANLFLVSFAPPKRGSSLHDLWLVDSMNRETFIATGVISANLSPDGSKIAYTSSPARGELQLHITTARGAPLLTLHNASLPSWSPDSTRTVFSSSPEGKSYDENRVTTLDLTNNDIRYLTRGQLDGRPFFHPSGEWILFVSGSRTGLASLWALRPEGGAPRQLTNIGLSGYSDSFIPPPHTGAVVFSPDGQRLAYEFTHDSHSSILILAFDPEIAKTSLVRQVQGLTSPIWVDRRTIAAINPQFDVQTVEVH